VVPQRGAKEGDAQFASERRPLPSFISSDEMPVNKFAKVVILLRQREQGAAWIVLGRAASLGLREWHNLSFHPVRMDARFPGFAANL
jgi:hypothetical protein